MSMYRATFLVAQTAFANSNGLHDQQAKKRGSFELPPEKNFSYCNGELATVGAVPFKV
jgi:hypothetical protein